MAYNLRNINPLDLRPSVGIGLALPFSKPTAFTTVYNTKEQLKYNIINFLLTDPRERLFNPTYGAGIRRKLFEQLTQDTLDSLEMQIRIGVEKNFPTVVITSLELRADPDRNTLIVSFSYVVNTTNETNNITLTLNG